METAVTNRTRGQTILATVTAAGVTLGVSEFLAGLADRIPSTISSIGTFVVDNVPGSIERWAIETFGTGDKAVLLLGIIATTLLIAGAVGVWIHRSGFAVAIPVFLGFGAVGLIAALSQALISVPLTVLAAVVAVGSGLYSLYWLLETTGPPLRETIVGAATDVVPGDLERRRFLGRATGLGFLAATGGVLGRRLLTMTRTSDVEVPAAAGSLAAPGPENSFNIDGLEPIIVPNDSFYRIDTALVIPRIDVDRWSMRIEGMVDNPMEFTFADLAARDLVEEYVTISCVSNQVGGGLIGNAKWTGVRLAELLEEARPQDGATGYHTIQVEARI